MNLNTLHTRHRGVSQTVHFASSFPFEHMHVPHVHLSVGGAGGAIPAADQSKAFTTGVGVGAGAGAVAPLVALAETPGRSASQISHFSVAEAGFDSPHVEHVQVDPADEEGGAIPAADQSNDFVAGAGATGAEAGRSASQIWHLSFAESGFLSEHVEHVHIVAGEDAAKEVEGAGTSVKSNFGREPRGVDLASFCAFRKDVSARTCIVNVNTGRLAALSPAAAALGSLSATSESIFTSARDREGPDLTVTRGAEGTMNGLKLELELLEPGGRGESPKLETTVGGGGALISASFTSAFSFSFSLVLSLEVGEDGAELPSG